MAMIYRGNRTQRAVLLSSALLGTSLLVLSPLAIGQSTSPASASQRQFAIPEQPLTEALMQFGRQSGFQVSADTALVAGRNGSPVSGAFSPLDALGRLLAGTGLTYRITGPTTLTLENALSSDAIQLGPVRVEGQEGNTLGGNLRGPSSDPVANRVNPQTTVGSKAPVSLREIPQTISVITQDQILDQSMRTVDDAMRFAPGVTTEINQPGFSSYYSRGFPISTTQFDGAPTAIPTSGISGPTDGLAMYDRVEVLYGPAGLLNGFGGDGGVINLVRKRAPDHFAASGQLSLGDFENGDLQGDVGGPLNAEGTLRGRIVGDEQYQHLMQDGTWQRNQQFYGTLEADLTPDTQVRVGASYTDVYGKPMYGFPNYTNYTLPDISRSAYIGPDWNHFSNQRTSAFAQVEQQLGSDWTAKLSYNFMRAETYVLTGSIITADEATGLSNRYSVNTDDINMQHAIDVYAAGPFDLFGREHHLTIGASYLHADDSTNQFLINPATGLDFEGDITAPFYDNAAYSRAFAGGPQNDVVNLSTQVGIYGNARFSLTDALTLVVSGRVTWWDNDSLPNSDPNKNFFGNITTHDNLAPKFSPMTGLIYDLTENNSVYASYSSIYIPQPGDETFTGKVIDPIDGDQYEIGEKGEYLNGRLVTSAALFLIRESNRAMGDPEHSGFDIAEGKVESEGFELRLNGEISPGWTLGASYTYTDYHTYDNSFSAHQSFSVVTPKHLFKLWTDYRLPADLSRWRVGGAIYASSKVHYTDSNGFLSNFTLPGGTFSAAGYATVDAHIGYELDNHWDALLSVTNLSDEKYISSLTTGGIGTYYGDPRKVLFTIRATY